MKVYINGEEREVPQGLSIKGLLEFLNIPIRNVGLAIAVNQTVVPKSQYEDVFLKEGDRIEIVHIVGGG
ncbi:sulfur carrier protein ThiS [Thermocrinis minervae]|uniref:Sulfur carrier protein n=1 Tax=Thermocrinis minervae TaxID=381751 RepID=A0A1M6QHP6_9AQUI|nr:sulfur carrier protein ThiS [Thermocrinis minervae]SHK19708.1 sulfur carrier protein [Thermocrinis minervae]